jgi:peptidoglycan glycosyltransferase
VNRPLGRLAAATLAALALVAGGLTYQQAVAGPGYRDDVRNPRALADRATRQRGPIITADGVVVALSEAGPGGDASLVRFYPEQGLYAHVVGYASSYFGDTGLEEHYADELRSGDDGSLTAALLSLLGGDLRAHQVKLTIRDDLQRAAASALGDQPGAVVALNPATGAVLALVSNPTFDPNILASGLPAEGDALADDPQQPLLNRATAATYPPGSSFKVLVSVAGLEASLVTPDTRFTDRIELELPGSTAVIHNADGAYCADGISLTLQRALVISCNTAFGELGMLVGVESLLAAAEAAGFNHPIPFDLATIASVLPAEGLENDLPALAQTSLGQRDVRATPLQMALVVAAAANGGVIMRPYLVEAVLDADGAITQSTQPTAWRRAMQETTADDLGAMMEQVVASGTGWRAAVPGVRVAGKTGTAEVPGGAPDVWFIGFGPVEAEPGQPQIAVAVLVEDGGSLGEGGSGGSVAAPIARAVMAAFFAG